MKSERVKVEGRFLRRGGVRTFLNMVTYGPFARGWERDVEGDFRRIREAGFEAVRLYGWPSARLLEAAAGVGLGVWAAAEWAQAVDFRDGESVSVARASLRRGLAEFGGHAALEGVFVGNEIPSDLARWMGEAWTRRQVEGLIELGRSLAPGLVWAYANYPTTEFLEPGNADVTAMNVYLEREEDFRRYLARLAHIAGDRPLLISEFGVDSRRHSRQGQAAALAWALRAAREEGAAGLAVYAWSDEWWNAGGDVADWDFGLTDREGGAKPALGVVTRVLRELREEGRAGVAAAAGEAPRFSVIVCTRNGRWRIGNCLRALRAMGGPPSEVVVVDDGSGDGTADFVRDEFPEARLVRQEAGGLGAARNAGAAVARGEVLAFTDDDCEPDADWLAELDRVFQAGWDAAGGPNLVPEVTDWQAAVVAAAPGAASHVMLDDREAEHVPGCNLAVRAEAFHAVGGFDRRFHTAGDDVDFCWRLRDAGRRIGFAPNAWVWHHRRATLAGYLRQQIGYGRAETLLMSLHPRRFTPSGDARWAGVIYTGAPVRALGDAFIYRGPMGLAGYQRVVARMQPGPELDSRFSHRWTRLLLRWVKWWAPRLRARARTGRLRGPVREVSYPVPRADAEFSLWGVRSREEVLGALLARGWKAAEAGAAWDVERGNTRVLIACERHDHGRRRILARVWGDGEEARAALSADAGAGGPALPQ